MFSKLSLLLASSLALVPAVSAGFSSSSGSNVAVYWGQNSYGQGTGSLAQQRLSYYCANTDLNIIPLAFLTTISNPTLNFASAGDICTPISGSSLFYCSELEADIKACQTTYGKTILLSIGGATYSEGGFASSAAATAAADNIFSIFGPNTNNGAPRPFGSAVVDGFDFDFESSVSNMVPFAQELRKKMDAATDKKYYLTAAPQCPYPDAADGDMLAGAVSFDAVFVQFYNNYCGIQSFVSGAASQNSFNFETWDNWAKTSSKNPNVKVMLGVPAASTAAGTGYISGSALSAVIAYSKTFSSFGGVMMWDMTQAYGNAGFLSTVASDLGGSVPASLPEAAVPAPVGVITSPTVAPAPTTKPAPAPAPTTMATVVVPAPTKTAAPVVVVPPATGGTGTVNQWNQCGGQDWTGGKVCKDGFTCKYYTAWYYMCV